MLRHEFIIFRSTAATFTAYMTISEGVSRVRESSSAVVPLVCPGPIFAWRYCDCLHDKVWVLCIWFRLQRQLIVQQFAQSTRHLAYSRLPDVQFCCLAGLYFLNSWGKLVRGIYSYSSVQMWEFLP